jgi:hypothetical protein
MSIVCGLLMTAVLFLTVTPLAAQETTQIVSANPLYWPLRGVSVEYERMVTPGLSAGIDFTDIRASWSESTYTSAKGFVREYLDGNALHGGYIGFTGGLYRAGVSRYNRFIPGVGVDWGYTWRPGRQQRFSVTLSGGITYMLARTEGAGAFVVPNVAVRFGYAF